MTPDPSNTGLCARGAAGVTVGRPRPVLANGTIL